MDAKTFDKSRLPGRHVTEAPARAPHRSCSYAISPTEQQRQRPFVGAGKTIKQNLENVKLDRNQQVVSLISQPICLMGGVVGLQGSLALDGAFVKVARMTKLQFRGPARAFDCEEDGFRSVENSAYEEGDILPIRFEYEGPKGGPGMRVKRRRAWRAPANPYQSGVLRNMPIRSVRPARARFTHAGRKAEVVCYADI